MEKFLTEQVLAFIFDSLIPNLEGQIEQEKKERDQVAAQAAQDAQKGGGKKFGSFFKKKETFVEKAPQSEFAV